VPAGKVLSPKLNPPRDWRVVFAGFGCTLPVVLIGTIRPFAVTAVRSRVSGSDEVLEREPREASITPETCAPARSTVFPWTTTFWSRVPVKDLPGFAWDEIAPPVRTTIGVPAGTVAASKDVWIAAPPQQIKIMTNSLVRLFFMAPSVCNSLR